MKSPLFKTCMIQRIQAHLSFLPFTSHFRCEYFNSLKSGWFPWKMLESIVRPDMKQNRSAGDWCVCILDDNIVVSFSNRDFRGTWRRKSLCDHCDLLTFCQSSQLY